MSIVLVLAELEDARRRIAELEAQLAAVKPKARKPRAVAGEACQYCGDRKSRKQEFLGLPMCSDWRPCAARARTWLDGHAFGCDRHGHFASSPGAVSRFLAELQKHIDADAHAEASHDADIAS